MFRLEGIFEFNRIIYIGICRFGTTGHVGYRGISDIERVQFKGVFTVHYYYIKITVLIAEFYYSCCICFTSSLNLC